MSKLVVAIDGPAASGKSSVARRVAARLACVYVDSGSLYRGLAWKAARDFGGRADAESVISVIESINMLFFLDSGAVRFTVDGVDPGPELRSDLVQKNVSKIAALPPARDWALKLLRGMTRFGCLVMEGRDIGTVVFPDTPYKFFLDADSAERARRRLVEMKGREGDADLREVEQALVERDALDSGREIAPLRKAPDARVIDTTGMTIDEVVSLIVNAVRGG